MSKVLEEALSIPEKIDYFNNNDKNNYDIIISKLNNKKIKNIITVARGTSDCAALFASYTFAKKLGLTTYSLPPSLITLEDSKFDFSNSLIIIISQSGVSRDLIECERAARDMGGETLTISNNLKSPLINTSNYFFYINAGEEKAIAATKTFALTLLIIIKFIGLIESNKKLLKNINSLPDTLIKNKSNRWEYKNINNKILNGFIISRGIGYALAAEMSLKFKELCQEQIEPFSSAEVMHGPKSLIQDSFKLFSLTLNDNSGLSVEKDIKELNNKSKFLYKISFKQNNKNNFYYLNNDSSELDPIIVMSKFYPWLINYTSLKGLDPDNPRYLNKVTNTY
jgi:glucosamine--fructose-6-phosphate aminotransferase (isomerizing)